MGIKHAAASAAAFLAGVLFAVSLAAGPLSGSGHSERYLDKGGVPDMQAGHALRGQAWATELFGRRHNRHLLAALTPDRNNHGIAA